uniref:Uncharacterized protein n=1 Tax=Physcomitrium patens TaxID=3218 RepID=A0A2K1IT05_PHYPA|nr:hypothetical protein PHYPA_026504 [Physcomitrium patens]
MRSLLAPMITSLTIAVKVLNRIFCRLTLFPRLSVVDFTWLDHLLWGCCPLLQ